ncbi:MAG: hypothetical protein MUQ00_05170, partial [Candidatus Aminicenantes bacterium]|nr:hypothetical protein [Candidatus Aminicenantes bacterium]
QSSPGSVILFGGHDPFADATPPCLYCFILIGQNHKAEIVHCQISECRTRILALSAHLEADRPSFLTPANRLYWPT